MSLEDALKANTEAILAQNELIAAMLERAGGTTPAPSAKSAPATEDGEEAAAKPKATKAAAKPKATKAADEHTVDSVKKQAAAWLGEFAKDKSDPETDARKAKFKSTLASLAKKEGFEPADEDKGILLTDVPSEHLGRVVAWIEKQKTTDAGFGEGRLTEVPGSGGSDDDGDGEEDI